jgi:hypothetical protein
MIQSGPTRKARSRKRGAFFVEEMPDELERPAENESRPEERGKARPPRGDQHEGAAAWSAARQAQVVEKGGEGDCRRERQPLSTKADKGKTIIGILM